MRATWRWAQKLAGRIALFKAWDKRLLHANDWRRRRRVHTKTSFGSGEKTCALALSNGQRAIIERGTTTRGCFVRTTVFLVRATEHSPTAASRFFFPTASEGNQRRRCP